MKELSKLIRKEITKIKKLDDVFDVALEITQKKEFLENVSAIRGKAETRLREKVLSINP